MKKVKLLSCVLILLSLPDLVDGQNVGISNVSFVPNYPLHIYHNAASGIVFQATNNTSLNTAADGFTMRLGNPFNVDLINNENGNISLYTNATERLRVNNFGISLINGTTYKYINFTTTLGPTGYGFRDSLGVMQYKHSTTNWTTFPIMPSIPGNVEWWIRLTGMPYIQPLGNAEARVYDLGQNYGFYYNGSSNLIAGYFRTTNATLGACAVQGFSDVAGNQTYGYLGYNDNITVGSTTVGGAAVHGRVDDPNRTAVYGRTAGLSDVAAMLGYSNVWIASYNWVDNASSVYNPPAIYGHLRITGGTVGGEHIAVRGFSERTTATNLGLTVGVQGVALGNAENAVGAYGYAYTTGSANNPTAGGFFYGTNSFWGNAYYAYVAEEYTGRKIVGSGSVSEIIATPNHGRIILTCPESPEYWYIDYGTVEMINGKAHVQLDPILAEICVIDAKNPLKVICQPNMLECNGVAVINKTSDGFDIVEVNGGVHSGEIDYQIVAKPKTNFGEGRFPQAPGPAYMSGKPEPEKARAANVPDRKNVYRWTPEWELYGYNPEDYVEIGDIIPTGPNAGKIKLGDGKYGSELPSRRSDLKK